MSKCVFKGAFVLVLLALLCAQCRRRHDTTNLRSEACAYGATPEWYQSVRSLLNPLRPPLSSTQLLLATATCPDTYVDSLIRNKAEFKHYTRRISNFVLGTDTQSFDNPTANDLAERLSLPNQSVRAGFRWHIDGRGAFLGPWFTDSYKNTLTNYNRGRAAYLLRNLVCDDLSPTSVAKAKMTIGGSDQHLSDPGCFSCHYKLDPMGGLFRQMDYQPSQSALVLQNATITGLAAVQEYYNHWRTDDLGYIRTPTDRTKNTYAVDIQNFFDLVAEGSVPEVAACLVRRTRERILGTQQRIDLAWEAEISREFIQAWSTASSSSEYQKVVRALVLSETYRAGSTRDLGRCYDTVPTQKHSAPCEARFVLSKYCTSCHNGTQPPNLVEWQQNNLGSWEPEGGRATLLAIQAALKSTGEANEPVRMPFEQEMPDNERANLLKWVNAQIGALPTDNNTRD